MSCVAVALFAGIRSMCDRVAWPPSRAHPARMRSASMTASASAEAVGGSVSAAAVPTWTAVVGRDLALVRAGSQPLRELQLPREASPAQVAKDGQYNNDNDDDPKPGRHGGLLR